MDAKSLAGAAVTGLVLFFFGFIYWGINPLPYMTLNGLGDAASAQAAVAELFPDDGLYFVPGPGNDPEALALMEDGPLAMISIDHSPSPGADPVAMVTGLIHNVLSALLLVLVIRNVSGLGARIGAALLVGVVAVFVINGSEIIWWQQPVSWVVHQAAYYLLYFALGGLVLSRFVAEPD